MISKVGRSHTSFYRRNVVLQTSFSTKISGIWLWEKMKDSIPVLARASAPPMFHTVWNLRGEGRIPPHAGESARLQGVGRWMASNGKVFK